MTFDVTESIVDLTNTSSIAPKSPDTQQEYIQNQTPEINEPYTDNQPNQENEHNNIQNDNTKGFPDTTNYEVKKDIESINTDEYTDLPDPISIIIEKKEEDLYVSDDYSMNEFDNGRIQPNFGNDSQHTEQQEFTTLGIDVDAQTNAYNQQTQTDTIDGTQTLRIKNQIHNAMHAFDDTNVSQQLDSSGVEENLWQLPSLDLLEQNYSPHNPDTQNAELTQIAITLQAKLAEFNIEVDIKEMTGGPTVSLISVQPAPGIKVAKITALEKDLARSLSVKSVRIVEIIPGKPYIGIEVPNKIRHKVCLYDIMANTTEQISSTGLTFALGKDIGGNNINSDLSKMPHLLISGTTGSGKSVGIHTIITSLICCYTPDQVKFILIDPKMLELSFYDKIPHLSMPVISNMQKAIKAFNWCIEEMEDRYKLMAAVGVRNIIMLNEKIAAAKENPNDPTQNISISLDDKLIPLNSYKNLAYQVIIIDEFADMIMQLGKKAEESVVRLAQKARASGMHLVLATQRPSVDVITGLIKANIPSRLSFMVSSKVDSRTVLDASGAEQLLGHGDLLFMPVGESVMKRIQGAFVSEQDIDTICDHWRSQANEDYDVDLSLHEGNQDLELDELYDEILKLFKDNNTTEGCSALQRRYGIGYNRAARILEQLEQTGIISPPSASKKRQLLI